MDSRDDATAHLAARRPPTGPPRRRSPNPMEQVLYEVKRTIVGQDVLLERLVVALLARGHILVEGVPGLAKTLAVKSLAAAIGGQFHRVQFTPDLVPADLVGTRIYHQQSGEFQVSLGPVFTNLLLADEINRAPAKVQSALLEVMQEQQVTIGRETHHVPRPFLVMATQNPIESEGTYPLPEAQVDRFMMKVLVGYPTPTEEYVVVERALTPPPATLRVIDPELLTQMQRQVDEVYVDPALVEYAVRLAGATREPATSSASASSPATSTSAPARGRRSTSSSPRGRWPSCAAATTRCRRTSPTWPSTCSATGWCCRTRRCPTRSPPTSCCAG